MADGDMPPQRVERGLVEHLRDQAEVLVDQHRRAVADRDAGRLLATMLKRIEAEVGELGDLLAGGPDAEDSARVLRAFLAGMSSWVSRPSARATDPSLRCGLGPTFRRAERWSAHQRKMVLEARASAASGD